MQGKKTYQEKGFSVTYYREEYESNNARVNSSLGRYMKGKRQSTVEPIFGTLTQFLGMRKVNTKGLAQANKYMHMSAIAYNPSTLLRTGLKKYLKFVEKQSKSVADALVFVLKLKSSRIDLFLCLLKSQNTQFCQLN